MVVGGRTVQKVSDLEVSFAGRDRLCITTRHTLDFLARHATITKEDSHMEFSISVDAITQA